MYEELKEEDSRDERYGWGRYTPNSLQILNSPKWATAFFCLASLIQGIVINGLLHYFLPTIERRFGFSSTESGCMSGAYDLAAMFCVIPATYLGGRRGAHRPRYVGCGLLLMGTGSLVFSLPAFFGRAYRRGAKRDLCDPLAIAHPQVVSEESPIFFWLLFIGNFLHGIGASPLYTLAVTYIDDNVPVEQASLYFGCYYMMAVIGPFLGYVAGGLLSQINGDIMLTRKSNESELTPENAAWVGCWWCGFLVCGICAFIFSIPILGLPKELPGTRIHLKERERLQNEGKKRMAFTNASQLPRAVLEVLKCFKFDFITAAACAEALIFSGMSAFLTKLLHLQFGCTQVEMALYMTVITVPSTIAGIYFGSSMIKVCQMAIKEILLMNVILMLCCAPSAAGVFISCPHQNVAGITVNYIDSSSTLHEKQHIPSLLAECNKDCNCDEEIYNPVCGVDNLEYYSACYAGCRKLDIITKIKAYSNCSCITKKDTVKAEAMEGPCSVPCPLFPLFVFLVFVYLFLSFSALIPSITATLRVVHTDTGSLALGVQWLFVRALGTIPGPIIFGKAIDLACVKWLYAEDGSTGNCLIYDHLTISMNLGLMIQGFKLLSVICFGIALSLAWKDRRKSEISSNQ